MPSITYPDKATNSLVTPSDMNQIKHTVNEKADADHRHLADEIDGLPVLVDQAVSDAVPAAPTAGETARALEELTGESRLSIGGVKPISGYRYVMISEEVELGASDQFLLSVVESEHPDALLTTAVAFGDADGLPAQMVAGSHFSASSWLGNRIDWNIFAGPVSTAPIVEYNLLIDGIADPVQIPADSAMPFGLAFSPSIIAAEGEGGLDIASLWQWGVAEWTQRFRLRAVSVDGEGPWSDWVSVGIDQSQSYFVPGDDWEFLEEQDSSASTDGLTRTILDGGRAIPEGWALEVYMGPLPYTDANIDVIEAAALPIGPGDNILSAAGHAVGTPLFAILLMKGPSMARKRKVSGQKEVTVQGRRGAGAPVVAVPPSTAGSGKIGSPFALGYGTWIGAASMSQQWLRNGANIPGATGMSYTPVAEDDLAQIACRVRGTATGGAYTSYVTNQKQVTYPAPTIGTPLGPQSFEQESGAYRSVDISAVFAGAGYTVTVEGPSVSGVPVCSVNQDAGTLGISVSSALADATVKLKASNSGGTVETSFSLVITAAAVVPVPKIVAVGGSNTAGNAEFKTYEPDDMILSLPDRNSASSIVVPDLAPFTGQYDWNTIYLISNASKYGCAAYRRCQGYGTDGDLGDWGGAPTYLTIRGVDWTDPIGTVERALISGGLNLDHPALACEGMNSIVISTASCNSGVDGQAPGLRPGATLVKQNVGNGVRKTVGVSAVNPVTSWPAAEDVAHTVDASASGAQFVAAIEIKGSGAATTIEWPDPIPQAKAAVTEVTDTAVATAQGFGGESGHLKFTTASDIPTSVTIGANTFTLMHELMGGENPGPAGTGNAVSTSMSYYSAGKKAVGGYAFPRLWWRLGSGASAVFRLAWSREPIEIQGLEDVTPPSTTWPAMYATGTGQNELRSKYSKNTKEDFYTVPIYEAVMKSGGGMKNQKVAVRGEAACPAGYGAFTGVTELDAVLLTHIRSGLRPGQEPAGQGGYPTQHELPWVAGCFFAKNTPRLWKEFTSTEKKVMELIVKSLMVTVGSSTREGSEGQRTMLDYPNSSTLGANPNIGSACRLLPLVGAAFLGGVRDGKAWLDSIDTAQKVRDLYDDLVDAGIKNPALCLQPDNRPARALSYAQIAAKLKAGWKSRDVPMSNPNKIMANEIKFAFSETVKTRVPSRAKGWGKGEGKILKTATPALKALTDANTLGMLVEFETYDMSGLINEKGVKDGVGSQGDRSSAEYGMKALRVMVDSLLVGLVSGMLSRDNVELKAAYPQFKVGLSFMREIARDSCGWKSYAQAGTAMSGDWYWSKQTKNDNEQWGMLPWFALGDVCCAVMDGTATQVYAKSYFENP